jgi:VWFA-related protein
MRSLISHRYLSSCSQRLFIASTVISVSLLIMAIGQVEARAQDDNTREPAEVIKVYSNLVSVPVIVSDRSGRYIAGLKEEDFKLFDNNTEQKLAYFDAAEAPLNVALLLDTSRSTQGVIDDIRKAARNFLKELRTQDRAMIVSFNYQIEKLSPLTSDRKVLERAIKQANVGEFVGTLQNDALMEVMEKEFRPISGRKAIVLLTDGQDAGSYASADEVLDYATESDAMIYSIYYSPSPMRPARDRLFRGPGEIFGGRNRFPDRQDRFPRQRGPVPEQRRIRADRRERRGMLAIEFLTTLADVSAGSFYKSETTDLKKTFAMIAEELRNQYRLGFYPDALARDGSMHQLRVKVSKPEFAVRARQQYRAAEVSATGKN